MTDYEISASFEGLFKERGNPQLLDAAFLEELFRHLPVPSDEQHVHLGPSRLVQVQAVFGGSVSPPSLEKFIVPKEKKEFVTPNNQNQSGASDYSRLSGFRMNWDYAALVIDTTAQVFGSLQGQATYRISVVILSDGGILGYFTVFNQKGVLRVC